jgi:Protein of unknown function (DUF2934)
MKSQTTKQAGEQKPRTALADQRNAPAATSKSARQARPSFDDLHAHIAARAYDLYAERGHRDGCALEDWLDAEQEILAGQFFG